MPLDRAQLAKEYAKLKRENELLRRENDEIRRENAELRQTTASQVEEVEKLRNDNREKTEHGKAQDERIQELELMVVRLARAQQRRINARMRSQGPTLFDESSPEQREAIMEALGAERQAEEQDEDQPESPQGGRTPPEGKPKRKPKTKGAVRPPKTLPDHLPREERVIDVPEEDRICSHSGQPMQKIGEERTRALEYVPAHFKMVEYVCEKYGCNCGACKPGVIQAQKPQPVVPGSYVTASVLAEVINSKLDLHLPLYRQQLRFSGLGFPVRRNTLCGWIGYGSDLLAPLVDAMRDDLLKSFLVNSDDTSIRVLSPGLGECDRGHIWV